VRKLFSVLIASLVLALLIPATTAVSASCWSYSGSDKKFAKKINNSRKGAGRGGLKLDPQLSKVAMKQTKTMISKNLLHHTPNLGKRVTKWNALGENVGYGGGVDSLHKAFMNSPSHKANILNSKFRYVGVGALKAKGFLWVTVVFQATKDPGTTLWMPKC